MKTKKDATIYATLTARTVTLTGGTYPVRGAIKAANAGFLWNAGDESWIAPRTPQAEALVSQLGATVINTAEDASPPPVVTPPPVSFTYRAKAADAETPVPPGIETTVRLLVAAIASQQAQASASLDTAAVQALIDASLDRVITRRIEVTTATETRTVEGLAHYQLPTLIRMVSTGQNVWLTGPSGAGKTHAAEQVAQALGLTYYFQGAMSMPHDLLGFVDANGKYHITPFVQAYESGGLLLLDELDSGSNEALLTLNAALSNGHTALPDGRMIKRHAQFRCIGGANTYGQGATAEYVGRTKLDAAFLQRFPVRLAWTYDERLERAMAGNDEWTDKVQKARAKAQAQGLKILITPRTTIAGADLIRAGFSLDDAAEYTYLAGLTPAQRDAIK